MSDDYHFFTEWRVAGTIEEVKAVLGDARARHGRVPYRRQRARSNTDHAMAAT